MTKQQMQLEDEFKEFLNKCKDKGLEPILLARNKQGSQSPKNTADINLWERFQSGFISFEPVKRKHHG